MRTLQLNHVAIHVSDVARSVEFYRHVLQLEPLPRPAFSFPGAWFRLGADQELHLIGDSQYPAIKQHRGNHFALLIDDVSAWEQHLQVHRIDHLPRRIRPDGAVQIFLSDPDGHFIELCTHPASEPPASPS
jgi:catechol 2,3-dioxygenase-like lactoylglutathione lyase family enzyme